MMKNQLRDYREKQKILYIDARSADELIAHGDGCLEENRIFDALEFYQKAKHQPGLEKILEMGISTGDAMLFEQTAKALRREHIREEWNRLGRQALTLKKFTFGRYAFEQSGDTAMLEEIGNITAGGTRKVE
jgi:hypothetical protein